MIRPCLFVLDESWNASSINLLTFVADIKLFKWEVILISEEEFHRRFSDVFRALASATIGSPSPIRIACVRKQLRTGLYTLYRYLRYSFIPNKYAFANGTKRCSDHHRSLEIERSAFAHVPLFFFHAINATTRTWNRSRTTVGPPSLLLRFTSRIKNRARAPPPRGIGRYFCHYVYTHLFLGSLSRGSRGGSIVPRRRRYEQSRFLEYTPRLAAWPGNSSRSRLRRERVLDSPRFVKILPSHISKRPRTPLLSISSISTFRRLSRPADENRPPFDPATDFIRAAN